MRHSLLYRPVAWAGGCKCTASGRDCYRVSNAETVKALCKKLAPPLVTLLSGEPEIQYVALRNINLIAQKRCAPSVNAVTLRRSFRPPTQPAVRTANVLSRR